MKMNKSSTIQYHAGPSGIIAEMLKAVGEEGVELVRQLTSSDWEESFFLDLYKGKHEALDCGNYHGLKLTDEIMQLLERVLDSYTHKMVNIDKMQFDFVPGRCHLPCSSAAEVHYS